VRAIPPRACRSAVAVDRSTGPRLFDELWPGKASRAIQKTTLRIHEPPATVGVGRRPRRASPPGPRSAGAAVRSRGSPEATMQNWRYTSEPTATRRRPPRRGSLRSFPPAHPRSAPLRSAETCNGNQTCPPSPRASAASRDAMIRSELRGREVELPIRSTACGSGSRWIAAPEATMQEPPTGPNASARAHIRGDPARQAHRRVVADPAMVPMEGSASPRPRAARA